MPLLLRRYLIGAFGAFIGGIAVITVLLSVLGHLWLVAFGLAFIWSLSLQFLAWGMAYVLWPASTSRFQERLRSSYGPPLAQLGRGFDRRLGFEIDPDKPSVGRARLLGAVVIALMLTAGVSSSWILLTTIDH